MSNVYGTTKALHHEGRMQALREVRVAAPVHLQIILSDYCTHSCAWCAYRWPGYSSNELFQIEPGTSRKAKNPRRFLDARLVRQVLQEAKDMGVKAVQFTGGGSPTCYPEFAPLAHHACDLGFDVALVTNGSTLHRPEIRAAVLRMAWVRVSVDAGTLSTYCATRQVGPGMWHRMVEGVKALVDARSYLDNALIIGIGFVATPWNYQEIHQAVGLYRSWGVDNVRLGLMFNPEGSKPYAAIRNEMCTAARRAKAEWERPGFAVVDRVSEKLHELDQGPPAFRRCPYQAFTTYLAGDAWLYRCCVTAYNHLGRLGQITKERGFRALWEAPETQRAILEFDARRCPRCQFTEINETLNAALAGGVPDLGPTPTHVNFV